MVDGWWMDGGWMVDGWWMDGGMDGGMDIEGGTVGVVDGGDGWWMDGGMDGGMDIEGGTGGAVSGGDGWGNGYRGGYRWCGE